MANPRGRLLNFISEHEVEEIKKKKGERGDTESTAPERPLFEVLKENKDKQQAEFNERFKHRPPKALDDDETEFLENVEMYKRQQEKQLASEEALELLNFQAAVASRIIAAEDKLPYQPPTEVKASEKEKRPAPQRSLKPSIMIKLQPKKAKIEEKSHGQPAEKSKRPAFYIGREGKEENLEQEDKVSTILAGGLVSYGTDSDKEDDH